MKIKKSFMQKKESVKQKVNNLVNRNKTKTSQQETRWLITI